MDNVPRKYVNPYISGILLGVVLFGTFFIMGRGLGASGGMMIAAAHAAHSVAPAAVDGSEYLARYTARGGVLDDWLFVELLGVMAGALISGAIGRRLKLEVLKGPRARTGTRIALSLLGGAIMGFGARFALGCTSGMALTGGATLALGSLAGMMCIFGGAYAAAWFFRRQWT